MAENVVAVVVYLFPCAALVVNIKPPATWQEPNICWASQVQKLVGVRMAR